MATNGTGEGTITAGGDAIGQGAAIVRRRRHPLSFRAGELTVAERASLMDTVSRSEAVIEVDILDGLVVFDWHLYEIALELGKPIAENQLDDHDPQGYLIRRLFGGRSLNRGQCAAIEVTLRSWWPTGRPGKTAKNAELADGTRSMMTTKEMAAEAHVCQTYIQMAKRVHRDGGQPAIRQVISGRETLNAADVRLSGRQHRKTGTDANHRPETVACGHESGLYATGIVHGQTLAPSHEATGCGEGNDRDAPQTFSLARYALGLLDDNRTLPRDDERLVRENRSLREKADRLFQARLDIRNRERGERRSDTPDTQQFESGPPASHAGPDSNDVYGQTKMLL